MLHFTFQNMKAFLWPLAAWIRVKTYFDDTFIFTDNYDILFVVLKLVLIVSRSAKIKFSIKTFFTQKIKILGHFFDTKDTILANGYG